MERLISVPYFGREKLNFLFFFATIGFHEAVFIQNFVIEVFFIYITVQ